MNVEEAVERELRAMTEWEGPTPGVWRRAAERAAADKSPRRRVRTPLASPRFWLLASAAAALAITGPFVWTAGSPGSAGSGTTAGISRSSAATDGGYAAVPEIDLQEVLRGATGGVSPFRFEGEASSGRAAQPGATREVMRRATLELQVTDVRGAVMRARQLVSEARGEFVESAQVQAWGGERAEVSLRVEAHRLEAVLSALRDIGEALSERLEAEDVTDRVVDLEARLNNERRVEQELLNLLNTRQNEKLDEILSVRRELATVRQQIERLTAQRDQLGALVRLSRVTVSFRLEAPPAEKPKEAGLWSGFATRLGQSARGGVEALMGTASGLLRILIGGLPWFVLAGSAAWAAWRRWRRARPLPE